MNPPLGVSRAAKRPTSFRSCIWLFVRTGRSHFTDRSVQRFPCTDFACGFFEVASCAIAELQKVISRTKPQASTLHFKSIASRLAEEG